MRIGQHESRHRRAIKVWDKREFKDLADDVELGVRNIKVALRRLRRFAREGAAEELDLDQTDHGTPRGKGYLDLALRPERRNAVKVLMFFDVGGSMDWHIRTAEELFSAARSEFKHLEYYYFHNCLYESVWRDNARRWSETTPTWQVLQHLSGRLQNHLRRRRLDEPLRDHARGRRSRAHERRSRGDVASACERHLPSRRASQPGARIALGLHSRRSDLCVD